eukprot:3674932-Pyramimonas_sp.AAC.1
MSSASSASLANVGAALKVTFLAAQHQAMAEGLMAPLLEALQPPQPRRSRLAGRPTPPPLAVSGTRSLPSLN